jgi:hypothetical protein
MSAEWRGCLDRWKGCLDQLHFPQVNIFLRPTPAHLFLEPYSAPLTLYPVAFHLDTDDQHAMRQNAQRAGIRLAATCTGNRKVSLSCDLSFFLVLSLQAFVSVHVIGWLCSNVQRTLNVLQDSFLLIWILLVQVAP